MLTSSLVEIDPDSCHGAKPGICIRSSLVVTPQGNAMLRRSGSEETKGRRAKRPKARKASIAVPTIADLQKQVGILTREAKEAREQQSATAGVLKVIGRSTFDLKAVLDNLTESAARLCGADMAGIARPKESAFHYATTYGFPAKYLDFVRSIPIMAGRGSVVGRALAEGRTVQVADVLADPEYEHLDAQKRAGFRTFLAVPMLREGSPIGVIALGRSEVRPFTNRQIELVTTFADQAVIAIENARLFEEVQGRTRELTDSLEQQTATSEVLKVISNSPGKLQPVFDAMLRNAVRICEAKFGNLFLIDADTVHWAAGVGTPPELAQFFTQSSWFRPTPGSHLDRVMRTKQVSHTADDTAEAVSGAAARHGGARSTVCVPMIKDDALVGAIFIYRTEVRPFTPKQIDLLKSFADQAVIAIENARLFEEVQAKTRGLTEVLTYQTGSANILKVIASSPTDVGPVLTAIVESACVICEAEEAHVVLRDGDELVFRVQRGSVPVVWKRQPINRRWVTGRAAADRRPVHVPLARRRGVSRRPRTRTPRR